MAARAPAWHVVKSEPAILTALVVSFLIFALPGPIWLALTGSALVVGLAGVRPHLAVALVPLTFPLTHFPRGFGALGIAPAEAAVIMIVLALGLRALVYIAGRRNLSPVRHAAMRPPTWVWLPALALLVVATISLATVADPAYLRESVREYRTVIVVPLVYAACAWVALRRTSDCRLALLALGAAGAGVGLLGAGQVLLRGTGVVAEDVVRAVGVYQHPNNLALFVGRAAAACFGLALAWPRSREHWLPLVLAAPACLGMLVTFSRGGWFALFGTLVFLGALAGRRKVTLVVLGSGLLLLAVLPFTGVERLTRILASDTGSGALRLELWRSALAMMRDHPLTGVGLDQFLYQYQLRYVAPEAWAERFTAHPHNLLLDFSTRLGILGLTVGVVLFGVAVWASLHFSSRSARPERALTVAAGGIICYSLLHGLVDHGFFLPDLALTFWLALIVLARAARPVTGHDGHGDVDALPTS